MADGGEETAELLQLQRSGHASQRRKRPSRSLPSTASRQGRLLYKVGGRHWRMRHVELTDRTLRCYPVGDDMAPILTEEDCEEVDLLGATLRLNPAKHKFIVITAADDGKAAAHPFRTEGEDAMEAWVVDLTSAIQFLNENTPGGAGTSSVVIRRDGSMSRGHRGLLSRIRSTRCSNRTSMAEVAADGHRNVDGADAGTLQCRRQLEGLSGQVVGALDRANETLDVVLSAAGPAEVATNRDKVRRAVGTAMAAMRGILALIRIVDEMGDADADDFAASLNQELASFVFAADGCFGHTGALVADAAAQREAAETASQLLTHTLFAMFQEAGLTLQLQVEGRRRSWAVSVSEQTGVKEAAAAARSSATRKAGPDGGGAAAANKAADENEVAAAAAAPSPVGDVTPVPSRSVSPGGSRPMTPRDSDDLSAAAFDLSTLGDDVHTATMFPVPLTIPGQYDPTPALSGKMQPDDVRRATIAVKLYNRGANSTFEEDAVHGLESALSPPPPGDEPRVLNPALAHGRKRRLTMAAAMRLVEEMNSEDADNARAASPDGSAEGARRGNLFPVAHSTVAGDADAAVGATPDAAATSAGGVGADADAKGGSAAASASSDGEARLLERDSTYGSISVKVPVVSDDGNGGGGSIPAMPSTWSAEGRVVDSMYADDYTVDDSDVAEADGAAAARSSAAGGDGDGDETVAESDPAALRTRQHTVGTRSLTRVQSGSAAVLLEHLLSDDNEDPDFLPTFVLCFPMFITLGELLGALLKARDACRLAVALPGKHKHAAMQTRHKRVCYVIRAVLEHGPDEAISEALAAQISRLVRDLVTTGRSEMAETIRGCLHERCTIGAAEGAGEAVVPPAALSVSMERATFVDLSSAAVAHELTRRDAALFVALKSNEVLAWRKEQSRARSPSVYAMIDHFNQVSLWVASLILNEHELRARARIFAKMVDLCKQLRKLHSFNMLLAVLSAFNSSAIYRLEQTAEMAGAKARNALTRLKALMSHADHYATLRAVLDTTKGPLIPYLGLYLTDITLVHCGNKDYVDTDKTAVNFSKCRRIFEIIRSIRGFQSEPHALPTDPTAAAVLGGLDALASNDLFDLSLHVEPRQPPPIDSTA